MHVTPGHRGFGATITGIDLRTQDSADTVRRLMGLLYRHRFLLIADQDLDEDRYSAFGRRWGEPLLFFNPSHRDQKHPELIVIHNRADTPPEKRNAALHWHVDGSYDNPPAATTLLYAKEGPQVGNETLFCDVVAAYEALPAEMKQQVQDLVVVHGAGDPRLLLPGETRGPQTYPHTQPTVHHPLVRHHPVTGERLLYAPSGSARGIVGMGDDEAIELLLRIKRHCVQERFVASAAARTGGLLIWDNYGVMHAATPTRYSDEDGERRYIYRVSTRDIPESSIMAPA